MSLESEHSVTHFNSAASSQGSPLRILSNTFRDLWEWRALAQILAIRDIQAQYRQSILGILWAFLPPLVLSVGLSVANANGIVKPGETSIPLPAYVFISMTLFQIFFASLQGPINGLWGAKGVLTRVTFPRETIVLAEVIKLPITFLIQIFGIVVFFIWFKLPFGWTTLLAPFSFLLLIMLGVTIGLLLTPIALLYRDLSSALGILMFVWLSFTPVAFPPNDYPGFFATTVRLNPVTPLLVTTRELALNQVLTYPENFVIVGIGTVLLFFVGLIFFRLSMPMVIERWSS